MALVEIEDLGVALAGSLKVLRAISFSLAQGGRLGIVGESGSGKSMTALALMGLLPDGAQVTGSIRLDGQELAGLEDAALCRLRGRKMAMVFQEPMTALNPLHRIGDQIAEPLVQHGVMRAPAARQRAIELLARVGMPDPALRARAYPHELSGGQRQRAMIAMALACRPKLLIADEPTTALDTTTQARILDLLDGLVREEGLALMLVSHDLGIIARYAEHIAVMYAGQIVEAGPAAAVLAHPAHPYTQGLMAARPMLGRRGRLPAIPGLAPSPAALPAGCSFAPRCPAARDFCTAAPVPILPLAPAHGVRCLRAGEWA